MKMVRAIVRPEKESDVAEALERAGIIALTKVDVFGRGEQKGIQMGGMRYDELPKVMLMVVVEDTDALKAVKVISEVAKTGSHGDGKIFLSTVDEAYTIRTGKRGL